MNRDMAGMVPYDRVTETFFGITVACLFRLQEYQGKARIAQIIQGKLEYPYTVTRRVMQDSGGSHDIAVSVSPSCSMLTTQYADFYCTKPEQHGWRQRAARNGQNLKLPLHQLVTIA